jgi:hypothetical protein
VQQVTAGVPANHFPTPSVADGLMLTTCAVNVVAFPVTAGSAPAPAASSEHAACEAYAAPGPGVPRRVIAGIALAALVVAAGFVWMLSVMVRRRRSRSRDLRAS